MRKAKSKYEASVENFDKGRYDSCVSEAYYACFQTVVALMVVRGVSEKKHTHVRGFVNKELARPGLIEIRFSRFYNELLDNRELADYNQSVEFGREECIGLKEHTSEFMQQIINLINKEINEKEGIKFSAMGVFGDE